MTSVAPFAVVKVFEPVTVASVTVNMGVSEVCLPLAVMVPVIPDPPADIDGCETVKLGASYWGRIGTSTS